MLAAESTNAQACSVAEMTVSGQEKTILFHTGYEDHGQSFWDYSGPGTLLWDWYGYPLPLVAIVERVLLTPMVPPWVATSSLAIASPRPVPFPTSLVV